MRYLQLVVLVAGALSLSAFSPPTVSENAHRAIPGPEATQNLIQETRNSDALINMDLGAVLEAWKTDVQQRTGIDFGIDYTALAYVADEALGENTSASGVLRAYGTLDLIAPGTDNRGGIVVKIENRHSYTSVAPQDFSGEFGYAGLVSSVFSDQGWRATNLYWQQHFAEGRGIAFAGWIDVSDFVDIYALASPWRGFANLAFQTGSGTIGGLPDGALGVMVGGMVSDNMFAIGSVVDANADATDILNGFDTLFSEQETFKTLELGWTSGENALFINNAHLTLWQTDERREAGTPDGYGAAISYTHVLGRSWLPFFRAGWADGGGSLYEAAFSAGFGYTKNPGSDLLAIGVNWSRPNEQTFGPGLDEQVTVEVFRRWQLTKGTEITPSLQLVQNPALNVTDDSTVIVGLRLRTVF